MKKYSIYLFLIIFNLAGLDYLNAAQLKIVASIPDLASIASYIGGDKVETISIAKGNDNPHFVEVLPSYMIRVSKATLYLKIGLALDQWADDIIQSSRNSRLTIVDCSTDISVLEKPAKADAILGDVHPQGNPHYWLNPSNGLIIAKNILNALKKADPDNSTYYQANFDNFMEEAKNRIKTWQEKMKLFKGDKIISYHSSWVYFAGAFNLDIVGNVEPLPGIPPTGKHLSKLISVIKSNDIKMLLQEPYFPDSAPKFLQRQTGIKIFKFAPSCSGTGKNDYLKHFDDMVLQITK